MILVFAVEQDAAALFDEALRHDVFLCIMPQMINIYDMCTDAFGSVMRKYLLHISRYQRGAHRDTVARQ